MRPSTEVFSARIFPTAITVFYTKPIVAVVVLLRPVSSSREREFEVTLAVSSITMKSTHRSATN